MVSASRRFILGAVFLVVAGNWVRFALDNPTTAFADSPEVKRSLIGAVGLGLLLSLLASVAPRVAKGLAVLLVVSFLGIQAGQKLNLSATSTSGGGGGGKVIKL